MTKFSLIIIGADNGSGLEELVSNQIDNILLIEPVDYNFKSLKERFQKKSNIYFENIAISDERKQTKFYYVKKNAIKKLGKDWASGIGSFKKKHLLDHHRKRFKITNDDIGEIDIQILIFDDLIKKYNIDEIKYLFIDTEGFDYNIIKTINFNKINIHKIKFEYKHLDDTFRYEVRLSELRNKFSKLNYKEIDFDNENITFEKISI